MEGGWAVAAVAAVGPERRRRAVASPIEQCEMQTASRLIPPNSWRYAASCCLRSALMALYSRPGPLRGMWNSSSSCGRPADQSRPGLVWSPRSQAFSAFNCPAPRAATRTLSRLRRLRPLPGACCGPANDRLGGAAPCPTPAPAPHKVAQDPTPRRQHTPTSHALIILNRARACRHTHTDPRARARAKQQQQHTHTHKQVCTRAHVPARDGRPGCRGRRAGVDRWGPDGGSAAMYRVV